MSFSYFASNDLESSVNTLSMNTVLAGSIILVLLVILALLFANKKPKTKLPIFLGIVITVLGTTSIIAGGTIYLNTNSYVGGPVHWHADFEVWACGNELELREPTGFLSNKIGGATLHEHNDKRIHVEGVPVTPTDVSLGKFMNVIGGQITKDTLMVPLNDNGKLFENGKGEEDGDGNGAQAPEQIDPHIRTEADGKVGRFITGEYCGDQKSEVQTFVYTYNKDSKTYRQTKLENPGDFSISPYGEVPLGDCVIMEFGPSRDRTDKLCKQYGVRDKNRCEQFGVTGDARKICEIEEVQ